MTLMIETMRLSKWFAEKCAVDEASWSVPDGSLSGLLGPNGAGKTTTLKMLLGMIRPTSGGATVLGHDVVQESLRVRELVASIPEEKVLYDGMRVEAFLRFYGGFFPGWNGEALREIFYRWGISGYQKIRDLSKGMRTKLLLGIALTRDPRVLLLDEPTEGLDPSANEEVLSALVQWVGKGERSAVLSTHRIDEVERICDRVVIIKDGRIVLTGDLDELRSVWKTIEVVGPLDAKAIESRDELHHVETHGGVTRVTTRDRPQEIVECLRELGAARIQVFDMNLREIYLAVVSDPGGSHGALENVV